MLEPQPTPEPTSGARDVTPYTDRAGLFRYGDVRLPAPVTFRGYGGTIYFDGHTVSITRGRFMRRMGRRSVSFPVRIVQAVEVRKPTLVRNGFIRILIPTLAEAPADRTDAKDPYAIMVTWQQRKKVRDLLAALAAAEKAGVYLQRW